MAERPDHLRQEDLPRRRSRRPQLRLSRQYTAADRSCDRGKASATGTVEGLEVQGETLRALLIVRAGNAYRAVIAGRCNIIITPPFSSSWRC